MRTARQVGALIRARRKELDLTQGDVAAAAGVSRQWVSEVEGGKATAELGRVLAVLDALDLDLRAVPRGAAATTGVPAGTAGAIDLDELLARYRQR